METDDVFTDQMQVCRPEFVKLVRAFAIAVVADSCDVVCKGIKPYIYYVFRIKVYRDSPFEGSSGYTEILKSRKKEVVHHLVFTGFRLDEIRMCIDVIDEFIGIFTHFEEVCFLFCRYTWAAAVRTFAIYKLGFCEERFTWCTIHSFVVSFVDIAFCIHFFEDFFDLFFMVFICGTDEFVVGCVHQIPDSFDLTGYVVYEFFWSDSGFFGF